MPGGEGREQARARTLFPELLRRLQALPGFESAALASSLPLVGGSSASRVSVPGFTGPGGTTPEFEVGYSAVSPGFFATVRIPLVRGRGFTAEDRFGSAPVAVVSQAMARQFWPGESAVGKTVTQGRVSLRVVGVAGDVRDRTLDGVAAPALYVPFAQQPGTRAVVVARVPATAPRPVVATIRSLDPSLAPEAPVQMRDMIVSVMPQRVVAPVVGAFGMLGLLLSTVGIYGLIAYFTAHRTREFGIRMALGATPRGILLAVVRRGLLLAGGGIAVGLPLALGTAKLLRPLLVGTGSSDVPTYAGVIVLMLLTALSASLLPARRATRIPPMNALRAE